MSVRIYLIIFIYVIELFANYAHTITIGTWKGTETNLDNSTLIHLKVHLENHFTVEIIDSPLKTVDRSVFKEFSNLTELIFYNNSKLNFLENKTFIEHPNLEKFNVTSCNVTKIFEETLSLMNSLQIIDLSNNSIVEIGKNVFKNNSELRELYLNDNRIKVIEVNAFVQLQNFARLEMDRNKHFDIQDNKTLLNSTSLMVYSCRNCSFTRIDDPMFEGMPNLKELSVNNSKNIFVANGTRVSTICMDCTKKTTTTQPSTTTLSALNKDSHLNRAMLLTLRNVLKNQSIVTIEDLPIITVNRSVFKEFSNLTELIFYNNAKLNFRKNEPFIEHPNLEKFNVTSCNVTQIFEQTLSLMTSLQIIDLSNNSIVEIAKNVFKNNLKLRELYLNDNRIKVIEVNAFVQLQHFKRLEMDRNKHFEIQDNKTLLNSTSLTVYSCRNCSITRIDDPMFEGMPNLKELSVNNSKNIFVANGTRVSTICTDCTMNTTTTQPSTTTPPPTTASSTTTSTIFVSSYLLVMAVIQGGIIALLVLWNMKLSRKEEGNDYIDMSSSVINDYDCDIYKLN